MFRHIRTKLAVALAVPLVALVALAGFQVDAGLAQRRSITAERTLATAALGPGGVVAALQNERDEASLSLIGLQQSVSLGVRSTADAIARTSAAEAQFAGVVRASPSATVAYGPAFVAMSRLGAIRAAARNFPGSRTVADRQAFEAASALYTRYTAVVVALLDGTSRVSPAISDGTLRTGAEILDATLRQSEAQTSVVHDVFDAVLNGGLKAANGSLAATSADLGAYQAWTARLASLSVTPYGAPVATLVSSPGVSHFTALIRSYLTGTPPDLKVLLAASAAGGASPVTVTQSATQAVAAAAAARADQLVSDANRHLQLYAALAALALLFGILVVIRISRSIARPLVRLAGQASDLADHRLEAAVDAILAGAQPDDARLEPIMVDGRDEVAQVASALAALQRRAVELATGQAGLRRNLSDALTNLGRRNQNLIARQLAYISGVEKQETDPDKLEQLFRLDHLATRMRRNAESLLVLGGAESPRQWTAPVAVSDVVRGALSEVEEFSRVQVASLEAAAVAGGATSDVAHILAELIENAVASSPPDTRVRVAGRSDDTGYTLAVSDEGIGMDEEALARANDRLSARESFTESPSRYLGHYVAGHLAQRHGIAIRIQARPQGVVALVHLPNSLLPERAEPIPADVWADVVAEPRPAPHDGGAERAAPPSAPGRPAAERHVAATGTPAPAGGERPTLRRRRPPAAAPAGATNGHSRPESPAFPPPGRVAGADAPEAADAADAPAPPAGLPAPTPAAEAHNNAPQAAPQSGPLSGPPRRNGSSRGLSFSALQPLRSQDRTPLSEPPADPTPPEGAPLERAEVPAEAHDALSSPPGPEPEWDLEDWLNSRLDQLEQMTLEQAVTAAPLAPQEAPPAQAPPVPAAAGADADTGGDTGGDAEGLLPRRRPGTTLAAGGSLLRRPAGSADGETAKPGPRVNPSLFRYLNAVEQKATTHNPEGTTR